MQSLGQQVPKPETPADSPGPPGRAQLSQQHTLSTAPRTSPFTPTVSEERHSSMWIVPGILGEAISH